MVVKSKIVTESRIQLGLIKVFVCLAIAGCGTAEPSSADSAGASESSATSGSGTAGAVSTQLSSQTPSADTTAPSSADSVSSSGKSGDSDSTSTAASSDQGPAASSSGSEKSSSSASSTTGGSSSSEEPVPDERVVTQREGENLRTTVDATSYDDWVPIDLDRLFDQQKLPSARALGGDWDISLKRYELRLNGGHNGDKGVEALVVEGESAFQNTLEAPKSGYLTDRPPDLPNEDTGLVFRDWYDYDMVTHLLAPKKRIYILRSSEGKAYKIQIIDYYKGDGPDKTSGHPSFRWTQIPLANLPWGASE